MKIDEKILEAIAHAAVSPDEVNWIAEDLEAYVLGHYIECSFLGDISMFLDKIAMGGNDDLIQIEAESLSKRITRNVVNSEFKGDHEAMLDVIEKTMEGMNE